MKSILIPGLALALFATPVLAQSPATRDPAQIQAGTYAVDPGHTQVGWRVSHMGFSNYAGGFSDVSGSLTLDPKKPRRLEAVGEDPGRLGDDHQRQAHRRAQG